MNSLSRFRQPKVSFTQQPPSISVTSAMLPNFQTSDASCAETTIAITIVNSDFHNFSHSKETSACSPAKPVNGARGLSVTSLLPLISKEISNDLSHVDESSHFGGLKWLVAALSCVWLGFLLLVLSLEDCLCRDQWRRLGLELVLLCLSVLGCLGCLVMLLEASSDDEPCLIIVD